VSVAETVSFECSHCSWAYTAVAALAEEQAGIHALIHPGGPRQAGRRAGGQAEPVRAVSAAELTRTRICEFPGCTEDADVGSWCFYHARHAAPEAPATTNGDAMEAKLDTAEAASERVAEAKREIVQERQNGRPAGYWTHDRILEAIVRWAELHDGKPPVSTEWNRANDDYPTSFVVKREFGSWARAIEQAGFDKPTRGGRKRSATATAPRTKPRKKLVSAARPEKTGPAEALESSRPAARVEGAPGESKAKGSATVKVGGASSLVDLAQAVEDAARDYATADAQLRHAQDRWAETRKALQDALDAAVPAIAESPPFSETSP
jgi:HNH endonuclease